MSFNNVYVYYVMTKYKGSKHLHQVKTTSATGLAFFFFSFLIQSDTKHCPVCQLHLVAVIIITIKR